MPGVELGGGVAVKVHSGEEGNQNFKVAELLGHEIGFRKSARVL